MLCPVDVDSRRICQCYHVIIPYPVKVEGETYTPVAVPVLTWVWEASEPAGMTAANRDLILLFLSMVLIQTLTLKISVADAALTLNPSAGRNETMNFVLQL